MFSRFRQLDIIETVENLSFSDRFRVMVQMGLQKHEDPKISRALEQLARTDEFYPQQLALMAAITSGERSVVEKALTGPSTILARLAIRPAARHLDDAVLALLLSELPAKRRLWLAVALWHGKRSDVIESTFTSLAHRAQAVLIAYCTPDFVSSKLAEPFAESLRSDDWARLATRQPEVTTEALRVRLRAAAIEGPDEGLLRLLRHAIIRLTRRRRALALVLLTEAADRFSLAHFELAELACHFPEEIGKLQLKAAARARARRADILLPPKAAPETITKLALRTPRALDSARFKGMRPATREALYRAGALDVLRDEAGILPTDIVAQLSAQDRHEEARKAFRVAEWSTVPHRKLPYAAFLPFAEAREALGSFLSQPEAALRSIALASLIGTACYTTDALHAVLRLIEERRNEQDPVRYTMLDALAALPPSRWNEAHLPALARILEAGRSADDASHMTFTSMQGLLIRMVPFHTAFAVQELVITMQKGGFMPPFQLTSPISRAEITPLENAVMPVLEQWQKQGCTSELFRVLNFTGQMLRYAPRMRAMLEALLRDKHGHVALDAFECLLLAKVPGSRRQLFTRLLADDPSWILKPEIARFVQARRQDLLTPFLKPQVFKGVGARGNADTLPAFEHGHHRWTQKQQETYSRSILTMMHQGQHGHFEMRFGIRTLARMPAISLQPVKDLAALSNSDAESRDIALVALGIADARRGMETLVEALGDDRARIAIYAMRPSLLDMPTDEALQALGRAPLGKVTVAKEVIRIAGDLEGAAACDFLNGILSRPDLHRHVRIVGLRALWSHLDQPASWDVIEVAACDPDPDQALAAVRIPQDGLLRQMQPRLATLMAKLVHHQAPVVRLQTLYDLARNPIRLSGTSLLEALFERLEKASFEEATQAVAALARGLDDRKMERLGRAIAGIGEPRVLQSAITALISESNPSLIAGENTRLAARHTVDRLIDGGRFIGLAVELAMATFSAGDLEDFLRQTSDAGKLHFGAMQASLASGWALVERLEQAELVGFVESLGHSPKPDLRRIALAYLAESAALRGWSKWHITMLDAFRGDASSFVAEAATLIFPPIRA